MVPAKLVGIVVGCTGLLGVYLASNSESVKVGFLSLKDKNEYFTKSSQKNIKILCRELYGQTKTDSGNPITNETEVKKYCSIDETAQ